MWPFNRKSKAASERGASVPVTKPVENPALEAAIFRHRVERTEDSSIEVGRALNAANYLVPVVTDEIAYSKTGDHLVTIEAGSVIKFMVCENTNGERFLPAFTSWHEIRLWAGNDANAFVMGAHELWIFALDDSNTYAGVVINPASSPWTLLPQNVQALLEDYA
ncbi:SseB family protein [Aeromonas veronii]|uniref:SseB family protein n=1 Tax=Aeromonas veronii TaxID=654 RepID=UPI0038D32364